VGPELILVYRHSTTGNFLSHPQTPGDRLPLLSARPELLRRKRSPDGDSTDWDGEHLIAAYYVFIDPERINALLSLPSWLTSSIPKIVVLCPPYTFMTTNIHILFIFGWILQQLFVIQPISQITFQWNPTLSNTLYDDRGAKHKNGDKLYNIFPVCHNHNFDNSVTM